MQHSITIPFDNQADDKKIVSCCIRHGVTPEKQEIRGQKVYKLTTHDVSNFYWLGANMEKSLK